MLKYYLFAAWQAIVDHALPLAGMLLTAILIPRIGRLAVRIREIVADTLERQVKDPRLGFVTITDVRVTAKSGGRSGDWHE